MLVDILFLQYRSLSSIPLLLWIPLEHLLTLMDPPLDLHAPSRSTISCCGQYHRPSSNCQTRVNALFCQMVDYYCTTITWSFPSYIFHMLIADLIICSLLLQNFAPRFSHRLTAGFLLLFQVELYFYHHAVIPSFCLLFLSWNTPYAILKVIISSLLTFTNQRCHYQRIYGLWQQYLHNQYHQLTSLRCCYPTSWVILYAVIIFYNGLTHPGQFVHDAIHTTYHRTLDLGQLLDLSPSIYWHVNRFKFDATCSQILASFCWWWPPLCVLRLPLWWYFPSSELFRKLKKHNISGGALPWRRWSLLWFCFQTLWVGPIIWLYPLGGAVQLDCFGIPYQSHSLNILWI